MISIGNLRFLKYASIEDLVKAAVKSWPDSICQFKSHLLQNYLIIANKWFKLERLYHS